MISIDWRILFITLLTLFASVLIFVVVHDNSVFSEKHKIAQSVGSEIQLKIIAENPVPLEFYNVQGMKVIDMNIDGTTRRFLVIRYYQNITITELNINKEIGGNNN